MSLAPTLSSIVFLLVLSFRSIIDLELGKVCEDLAHSSSRQSEILDHSSFKQTSELAKGLRKTNLDLTIFTFQVDALNLKASLKSAVLRLISLLDKVVQLRCCLALTRSPGLVLIAIREHNLGLWDQSSHHFDYVRILDIELLLLLLDRDSVALSIGRLQIVGRAKDNESTVYHNGNLVAKLLCFVHPVSRQEHRGCFHALNHAVERSSRNWIDSSRRLIKEKNPWAEHNRLCTAQLTLIATTEVLGIGVLEGSEVQVLHDELLEVLTSLSSDAFESSYNVETLIDGHVLPHEVLLVADAKELAKNCEIKLTDVAAHELGLS